MFLQFASGNKTGALAVNINGPTTDGKFSISGATGVSESGNFVAKITNALEKDSVNSVA